MADFFEPPYDGTPNPDEMFGTPNGEVFFGMGGADNIFGEGGGDKIYGGGDGDELFGGNSRYAMQKVFGWYGKVPPLLRRGVLEPFFGLDAVARLPLLRKGSGYIRQATTPLPDRMQAFNLLRRLGFEEVLPPALLEQIDPLAVLEDQRRVWLQARSSAEVDSHLAFDWRYTLAENDLPKVRGSAELAGVQVGFPMLDDALVDFSMRLPAKYKLKGLRLRWFFKEALKGFLPDEIITKKKQGFGLPFGVWMVKHQALQALASDSVRALAARGIIREPFVERLLREHLPSHPHYYGNMVWILMMQEQWLRSHADGFRLPR